MDARAPLVAALADVTVIDCTAFESGPICTEVLGFMGATVIKVERPGAGEPGRAALRNPDGTDFPGWMVMNANKKSITLDLGAAEGRRLMRALLQQADVLVENMRPGAMARLGLDYDSVRQINERIIYASIKGFGAGSPFEHYPAFDPVGQATGGVMSVTGWEDGPPLRVGPNLADTATGWHCAMGILAALYQRQATGVGQRVESPMQDVMVSLCRPLFGYLMAYGHPPRRMGNGMPMFPVAPAGAYRCRPGGPDDYCAIYVSRYANDQWHRLLAVIGRADLKDDPRFATAEQRWQHRHQIDELLAPWMAERTKFEAMAQLGEAGVPAGAVLSIAELYHDPSLRARGTFATVEHPDHGPVALPGFPVRMSASDVPVAAPPRLGEHNDEVYQGLLGLTAAECDRLRQAGVI